MRVKIVPPGLYPEPTVRELTARPDAEETFARVARYCDDELVATLTALAVLRARAADERMSSDHIMSRPGLDVRPDEVES